MNSIFYCLCRMYQSFPYSFFVGKSLSHNLFICEWRFGLNIHINFAPDWIIFDIWKTASTFFPCYFYNLSNSLIWSYFPFFRLSGPYNHNSLLAKTPINILQDRRFIGIKYTFTCGESHGNTLNCWHIMYWLSENFSIAF